MFMNKTNGRVYSRQVLYRNFFDDPTFPSALLIFSKIPGIFMVSSTVMLMLYSIYDHLILYTPGWFI